MRPIHIPSNGAGALDPSNEGGWELVETAGAAPTPSPLSRVRADVARHRSLLETPITALLASAQHDLAAAAGPGEGRGMAELDAQEARAAELRRWRLGLGAVALVAAIVGVAVWLMELEGSEVWLDRAVSVAPQRQHAAEGDGARDAPSDKQLQLRLDSRLERAPVNRATD